MYPTGIALIGASDFDYTNHVEVLSVVYVPPSAQRGDGLREVSAKQSITMLISRVHAHWYHKMVAKIATYYRPESYSFTGWEGGSSLGKQISITWKIVQKSWKHHVFFLFSSS